TSEHRLAMIRLLFCLLFLTPGLGYRITQNEASLYNKDDNVEMLDSESLPSTLSLKPESKLVQFLNSFCGDCQRFAPVFKSLSRDLYQWRKVLRVYAVDCAQERNVEICREFNIRQTPTLRYFSSELAGKELGLGVDIPSQDPKVIVSTLADLVSKDKYESPGQPNFGYLKPYETLSSLFQHDDQAFVALVYQPKDSQIGRDSILSLLPYDQVAVRVFEDYHLLSHLGIQPSNSTVFMIDRKGKTKSLSGTEGYKASIGKFLESLNYKPEPPLPEPIQTDSSEFLDQQKQAIIVQVLKQPRKIYRADLEQAVDKLLHIELPKALILRGDNFTALHSFLRVLSQLNPLNKNGKILLLGLDKALAAFNGTSGSEFADTVAAVEKPLPKVFKGKRYVGCVSSKPFLRGFTCSLWSLFHFLTVEAGQSANQLPPGTVLSAIHGFVKYFFGCSDCSNHFQEMAKRRRMDLVRTHDEEILWLWAGHNEVNERLSGDATEDPQFPKIQFPSPESCPSCRNNASEWQTGEVLQYLKSLYGKDNLSFYGLPTSQGYN
ncbi:hypothetical protein KR074_012633, partial [Drosophila pseudoananassae]